QIDAVEPREGLQLDEDIGKAIQKMKHIKKLMTFLPGFDCGACGAPSCRALAEDIAQDQASISYCVFVQRVMEKNYKLSPEQSFSIIEKIWGQNRLNKYTDENES
ncbi:MAG: ferredoxin, partial [Dysgonomonadaceae bacterium]|nr:ferredoxin [Dysgonamonadaceae bacterium]